MQPRPIQRFSTIHRALCALTLFWSSCVLAASPPALVINDTNSPPFTTAEKDGFLDIIVREAFKRAGSQVELTKMPAERALLSANSGLIDGDLTRIEGLERIYPNLVRVPEKLVDWEFVAFTKAHDMRAEWPVIKARSVGHITGWKIYEKALDGAEHVVHATGPEQLFKLLDKDRVDIVLHARWMGQGYLQQLKVQGIHEASPVLARKEMFIYLNQRHQALAERLAASLAQLKQEGFYERVWQEKIAPYQSQGEHIGHQH